MLLEIILFTLSWIGLFALILTALVLDNILWIPTSSDGNLARKDKWGIYLKYILKNRMLEVYTHWRDIIPAIFSSLVLTLVIYSNYLSALLTLLTSFVIITIWVRYEK